MLIRTLLLAILAAATTTQATGDDKTTVANDVTRLNPIPVVEITQPTSEQQLQQIVLLASREHKHIAIAGKRHSQGGQTAARDAIVVDMTRFNRVLAINVRDKWLRIESGATWKDVQDYANPFGLAVEVQQSSNIFTVGGSLGVNCHGRDPRFGPVIQTVRSFRLLTADGKILTVSRTDNPELFALAIGGYGLFGIILDVDLRLTENKVYERHVLTMDYHDYPEFFAKHVQNQTEVGLHFAWASVRASDFLQEFQVFTFVETHEKPKHVYDLTEETHVARNKAGLAVSRHSRIGKDVRWYFQELLADRTEPKILSRNNAMRPGVKFLDYHGSRDTDILQEYFVPVSHFTAFTDRLRSLFLENKVNLLSMTIRYVPKNEESFLSYSRGDSFAFVLYINQGLPQEEQAIAKGWTQKLVDAALLEGGTYYLPYQQYPTGEQLRAAYPKFDQFIGLKRRYDPNDLFTSSFYQNYSETERRGAATTP